MSSVSEFNEFEPSLKSAKNRFQLSAGLNIETINTILRRTAYKFKLRLKFFKFGLRTVFFCCKKSTDFYVKKGTEFLPQTQIF